jgi:hypothetical protein
MIEHILETIRKNAAKYEALTPKQKAAAAFRFEVNGPPPKK